MAINLSERSSKIRVISRLDDSITAGEEAYSRYLETLDESLLDLDETKTPVRFVLNCELDFKAQRLIKKDQMSSSEEGMSLNIGFMMTEVRVSLVDIENPSSPKLSFVKSKKDSYADEELVARLESYGILQDLFTARQNAVKPEVSKKN